MAHARKIPTKKMMLATYEDFFKALWRTFSSLSKGCFRIDIVFDTYLRHSIKQGERNRRSELDPIETNITSVKQQLPVEMDRFWPSSENKMKFQQSFIKWACCNCVSEVPIYLSGAGEENVTACIKVCWNDPSDDVDSLRNTLEEADDCMMFHVVNLSLPKTLKVSSLLLVIQMYLFVQSTISIDGFIVVWRKCE